MKGQYLTSEVGNAVPDEKSKENVDENQTKRLVSKDTSMSHDVLQNEVLKIRKTIYI